MQALLQDAYRGTTYAAVSRGTEIPRAADFSDLRSTRIRIVRVTVTLDWGLDSDSTRYGKVSCGPSGDGDMGAMHALLRVRARVRVELRTGLRDE